jgi:hypothetical protein
VNPRHRPATVRFYFDADVLGLAKVIVSLRSDATYAGDQVASYTGGGGHRVPSPVLPPVTRTGFGRLLVEGG